MTTNTPFNAPSAGFWPGILNFFASPEPRFIKTEADATMPPTSNNSEHINPTFNVYNFYRAENAENEGKKRVLRVLLGVQIKGTFNLTNIHPRKTTKPPFL